MKTAVELFWKEIQDILPSSVDTETGIKLLRAFEKAKEIEEENIINAHYQGYRSSIGTTEISEKYFNETFKSE
jgi:divalent metal cation (Fe/Co/Zn/Cd) transporter